jgi:hypothetical protein
VTIARFLRRGTASRRVTHLAIVVLPNEATAFQVTRLLHYHGVSPEHLAIVGAGYSSPDRVGLKKPAQIAARRAKGFALNAAVLGGLLSLIAVLTWRWETNLALLVLLTVTLSAIVGAIVGAAIGYFGEGTAASIYRHHLNQGRYLLMIEGPETLVLWSREVLSQYSSSPSP